MDHKHPLRVFLIAIVCALSLPLAAWSEEAKAAPSAAQAFERLKSLAGDWIDVDGVMGMKGEVAVTYRVSGAGSVVIETQFAGAPHEMVNVFYRDGETLAATHYCAAGNQPRFRSNSITESEIHLGFDGGTNLDPAKDNYIREARIEFVSADEIRTDWAGWSGGKADTENIVKFHLVRKK